MQGSLGGRWSAPSQRGWGNSRGTSKVDVARVIVSGGLSKQMVGEESLVQNNPSARDVKYLNLSPYHGASWEN